VSFAPIDDLAGRQYRDGMMVKMAVEQSGCRLDLMIVRHREASAVATDRGSAID
jgi:hypothetical protein